MRRNRKKGFTLVEVIVVAVIIAVLAAIGIPIYNGFVADARRDTVGNLSQTAAAAANIHFRKTGTALTNATLLPNVQPLFLSYDATKYTIIIDTGNDSLIKVTAAGVTPVITVSSRYK